MMKLCRMAMMKPTDEYYRIVVIKMRAVAS